MRFSFAVYADVFDAGYLQPIEPEPEPHRIRHHRTIVRTTQTSGCRKPSRLPGWRAPDVLASVSQPPDKTKTRRKRAALASAEGQEIRCVHIIDNGIVVIVPGTESKESNS